MNCFIIYLFLLSNFVCTQLHAIIIIQVSPPRSLSTCFLRMMQERGDFQIMNEPFIAAFCKTHGDAPKFRPESFCTADQVKEAIWYKAKQGSNLFVKDMSCAVLDALTVDDALLSCPEVYFIALIRNPHHALISFYKKILVLDGGTRVRNFNKMADCFGYKEMYELIKVLKQHARNGVILTLSEDLEINPHAAVRRICEHCGIEFKPESLSWSPLGADFTGVEEWHEGKIAKATHFWHGDAINSTGFIALPSYHVDRYGDPTFSEIKSLYDRTLCMRAYGENKRYYDLIVKECGA